MTHPQTCVKIYSSKRSDRVAVRAGTKLIQFAFTTVNAYGASR